MFIVNLVLPKTLTSPRESGFTSVRIDRKSFIYILLNQFPCDKTKRETAKFSLSSHQNLSESQKHWVESVTPGVTFADISQRWLSPLSIHSIVTPNSWCKWIFVTCCIISKPAHRHFPSRFLWFYLGNFDVAQAQGYPEPLSIIILLLHCPFDCNTCTNKEPLSIIGLLTHCPF